MFTFVKVSSAQMQNYIIFLFIYLFIDIYVLFVYLFVLWIYFSKTEPPMWFLIEVKIKAIKNPQNIIKMNKQKQ